jgi:hypothetical protein
MGDCAPPLSLQAFGLDDEKMTEVNAGAGHIRAITALAVLDASTGLVASASKDHTIRVRACVGRDDRPAPSSTMASLAPAPAPPRRRCGT